MNKKSEKRRNFVLEKSGKPQSDFCTNPESTFLYTFGGVNSYVGEC